MNWLNLVKIVAMAVLGSNPKTAPIANEVSDAISEAEQLHGDGTGSTKLQHVLKIAKDAAQSVDELKGSIDDVEGPISVAVNAVVSATNQIVKEFSTSPV